MQKVNEIFGFLSPKQLTTLDNKTLREEAATTLANLYPHDLEKDELAVEIESFKYSVIDFTQIAILVCSNLALQICMHAASLTWQECKLETTLKQVIANEEVTTRRTCSKLVASNSLQTIAKTEYADEPQIRTLDNRLPKTVALATQQARPRLRKTDYANISCIYTFYFKLSS
ncbi:hypothetical protein AVEN_129773-1 [Araneus ventricosus]|uniref:Uncharacterized protein n=1 Tax=Araneus ventricosus TaxID=182803 RepID=A0A4Y2W1Y5_ARAVE|nr:hypothetical protein AVEN_129773-1 [Araneus ventricosus]